MNFAVAVAAFNLVCSGTITSEGVLLPKKVEAYTVTYRIDLNAKRWCEDACKAVWEIAQVQPTRIILKAESSVDTATERSYYSTYIDRETGEESTFMSFGRGRSMSHIEKKGQCERQPFSGFPEFKTRF